MTTLRILSTAPTILLFLSAGLDLSVASPVITNPIVLTHKGVAGSFRYTWQSTESKNGMIGAISVDATFPDGKTMGTSLQIMMHTASGREHLTSSRKTGENEVTLQFEGFGNPFEVTAHLTVSHDWLACEFKASEPRIARFQIRAVLAPGATRQIKVPYYSGEIHYTPATGAFTNGYLDWTASGAMRLEKDEAVYDPLTDGRRNTLHERYLFAVGKSLDSVFPEVEAPASPYLQKLAGSTIVDIWNQQDFSEITRALENLSEYGVHNCVVLIHNWQKAGYDNALPTHYPANSEQGGDAELKKAINAAHRLGCRAGLHQNYVDYYPNADHFTEDAIARNTDGSLIKAWLNGTTHIQSFATRPAWFVKNAATQANAIHALYGTDASFLDVSSAVFPWFRADMQASQAGAGKFATAMDASRELWALERNANGGPVFGEGLNHWFWSGLLDGVEAQLGAGVPASGEQNPLMVDFDLLRMHPLQVNHGMGMYDRWTSLRQSALAPRARDAYRMQEVIYGHSPYIGGNDWESPWEVLAEEELVGPVARRYGTETVKRIDYEVNGAWVDGSDAAKAADWSRVAVQYKNGDKVAANKRREPLTWEGLAIPQYGWAAKGEGLLAYTAMIDGRLVDYSQTADTVFANARNQKDRAESGKFAEPVIAAYEPRGFGRGVMRIDWKVLGPYAGADLTTFVHFVDSQTGHIAFQADHAESRPASTWKTGELVRGATFEVRIPATVPDGSYTVRIGLYRPGSRTRIRLSGDEDEQGRYKIGTLLINKGAAELAKAPEQRPDTPAGIVDFQSLKTDGMVMLKRQNGGWNLQAYPGSREVTVQLNVRDFPLPSSIGASGHELTPVPQVRNNYWTIRAKGSVSYEWKTP